MEKSLTDGVENSIFSVANDFRKADTGGVRNEKPLTEEQKEEALEYALSLGMPRWKIFFLENTLTGYWSGWDYLTIGTDVAPNEKWIKDPNGNISIKGTIAHELVGHREAELKGLVQEEWLLEEAQASIRAARFAPELSWRERIVLLRDAIYRLNKRGIFNRNIKHKLNINER